MGTSAPPTGITSRTPNASPSSASTIPAHITGSATSTPDSTSPPSSEPAKTTARPGKTTGREVISSWSLANVITEPAKDTEPTKIVNAVATRMNQPTSWPVATIASSD